MRRGQRGQSDRAMRRDGEAETRTTIRDEARGSGLCLGAKPLLEFIQGDRRLLTPSPNELPKGRIGLEDHILPILALDTDQHCGRLSVSFDDDPA